MVNLLPSEYKSETKPIWCAGCGAYGVLSALFKGLSENNINPKDTVLVSGIGCSSRLPDYVRTYGFHGAHGRALPVAAGVKMANPDLNVFVVGGDGDGLSIGVGHLVHTARRNPDITYLLLDNSLYGMTKGQYSPSSKLGSISGTSPYGSRDKSISPIALAITLGVTFVARAYSGNPAQLKDIITEAVNHKGFSFVEVICPCVTFGDKSADKKLRRQLRPLPDEYTSESQRHAMTMALTQEAFYTGVLYTETAPTMNEGLELVSQTSQGGSSRTLECSWERFK